MFAYNDQQLRGVKINGEPWFVAKDVCRVLSYAVRSNGTVNTTAALKGLDSDEKGVAEINTPGGNQRLSVVSRPGLFKLIQRSNKPEAKAFDRHGTAVHQGRSTGSPMVEAPNPLQ